MGQIKWYKRDPDAALNGMSELTLEERGAYNTVLDLIYSRDGMLKDSDPFIAGWCDCDVRVWKRIKKRLLDLGKLYIEDGMICNERADEEVVKALSRVASARDAGEASARSKAAKLRQELNKNKGKGRTAVGTEDATPVSTNHTHTQKEPNGSSPHVPPSENLSDSGATHSHEKPKGKVSKVPMTPDWMPGDLTGDVGDMLSRWPQKRIESEIADFREYWIEDGSKRPGWDRTFRSRIRNIHDRVMRENRNGNGRNDNRDGLGKVLDDIIFAGGTEEPAGEGGRSDIEQAGSYVELPLAPARRV